MDKNETLRIQKVANGFILDRAPDYTRNCVTAFSEIYVFSNLVALFAFLKQHYPERK